MLYYITSVTVCRSSNLCVVTPHIPPATNAATATATATAGPQESSIFRLNHNILISFIYFKSMYVFCIWLIVDWERTEVGVIQIFAM